MNSMRTKLTLAGLLLSGAFGYLAMAGMQQGWVYYVGVDQYVADTQYHAQRVRLHGKVAEDGFSVGAANASFRLAGTTQALPVVYRGAIPDMFQAGRDVVVEGRRGDDGVFRADLLMTKCASKYEADSPHANANAEARS